MISLGMRKMGQFNVLAYVSQNQYQYRKAWQVVKDSLSLGSVKVC